MLHYFFIVFPKIPAGKYLTVYIYIFWMTLSDVHCSVSFSIQEIEMRKRQGRKYGILIFLTQIAEIWKIVSSLLLQKVFIWDTAPYPRKDFKADSTLYYIDLLQK